MTALASHYFHLAVSSAERKGLDRETIFAAIEIDAQALQTAPLSVTPAQLCRLWQYLWDALADEFLGFTEKPCKRGTFALACKLACQTSSLKQLFREVNRTYQLVDSDLMVGMEHDQPQQVAIYLQNRTPDYDIDHFSIEYFLFYWHRLACWVTNTKLKPLRAEFSYPRPAHGKLYESVFQCPVVFNAQRNALLFDERIADLQPIRTRLELYDFLNQLPAGLMSLPGRDSSLATKIKVDIINQSVERLVFPPLEQLAKDLNLSRTTLMRKLNLEHSSYRQLKEEIRCEVTMEKLRLSKLSVTEIALQVGFAESSSLNRAFKKWTGMTPQQFRGQQKPIRQ
jgi:AraC-like DNA-binding protein